MQAGRNHLCPCGSGKKFKHCHARSEVPIASLPETTWRRLRTALQGQPATMMRFVRQVYGLEVIEEAWDEFELWDNDDPAFDPDTPHIEIFLPWFYHHWAPAPPETLVEDRSLHDRCPTSVLLERRGDRLDPLLRRYLEACVAAPFSFYDVLRCEPGHGLGVRDVFTGAELDVLERSASRTLEVGDTFFGQLVTVDGITIVEALARHAIPLDQRLELVDFRQRIGEGKPFTNEMLREWDMELRGLYLEIMDHVLNPPVPRLHNTDGEEIVFHRLYFEIDSARDALAALKDLAYGETEEDLLADAELDADGQMQRVSLDWRMAGNALHKSWDNTVLGHIEIDGHELRADVNSAERAARLRALLEERLGSAIRHVRTAVERAEDVPDEEPSAAGDTPPLSLEDHPELRERIQQLVSAHYESWVTEPIPALGGRSPLEAVQDPAGREKVEALVAGIERRSPDLGLPVDEGMFTRLRERLGLERDRG